MFFPNCSFTLQDSLSHNTNAVSHSINHSALRKKHLNTNFKTTIFHRKKNPHMAAKPLPPVTSTQTCTANRFNRICCHVTIPGVFHISWGSALESGIDRAIHEFVNVNGIFFLCVFRVQCLIQPVFRNGVGKRREQQ